MPWFKVDDGFHGHPKVLDLSLPAVGLWTLAGSWCAKYLTDGVISMRAINRLGGTDGEVLELIEAGLWWQGLDGDYRFKDWDEYQPLKADVEAEREAARERMKTVRAKKKGVQANVQANNTGTFGGSSEEVRSTPTHPDPTLINISIKADRFDEFWAAYPRKVGKQGAVKAYNKALKIADAGTLLSGAEGFARLVTGKDPKFIPHPATWLNDGRWDDEYPAARAPQNDPWSKEFHQ